jgi:hypothetical protein
MITGYLFLNLSLLDREATVIPMQLLRRIGHIVVVKRKKGHGSHTYEYDAV